MLQFLLAIPEIVLYGCGVIVVVAFAMGVALCWLTWRVGSRVRVLTTTLKTFARDAISTRDGLPLAALDEIRRACQKLGDAPRGWWTVIESHVERYISPEDVEGWFLTEKPREALPYEIVIGKNFNSAMFSAFPGL